MDNPLLLRMRRSHLLTVVFIMVGACSREDSAFTGSLEDTLDVASIPEAVDTFAGRNPASVGGQLPAAEPGSADTSLPSTTVPVGATIPRPSQGSTREPVVRAPSSAPPAEVDGIVTGRVEVEIDPKTFVPADYLLVRIESPGHRAEAWTSREGEFYFAKVPAGRYALEVLLSPKEPRPVYSAQLVVGTGQELRVPPVHIPVTSMKGGAR